MTVSPDQKYTSYIQIYSQLDGLMWRMPTLLSGGITLVFSIFLGSEGTTSPYAWTIVLAFSSVTTLLGAYGMHRIRLHQGMVGIELRKLENSGYFHARKEISSTGWLPKIPTLYISFFIVVSVLFAAAACLLASGNGTMIELISRTSA